MTRNVRRYSGATADHMAGSLARFDGECPRCSGAILARISQVVQCKGRWVHTSCMSGAGDE